MLGRECIAATRTGEPGKRATSRAATPVVGSVDENAGMSDAAESLLHLTERPLWDAAQAQGEYRWSTRGVTLEQQGFVHCSLRHQLRDVAYFVYGNYLGNDLVVLVIDPTLLSAPVRFEAPEPGGPEFPHIYGPIPVSAVVAVEDWPAPAASV